MTIYPFTLHFGSFAITGFGLMMMFAFLVAGWIMRVDLRQRGLNEAYSGDIIVAGVIGGIIGAKLWYVALTRDPGALFTRGGLVWYGGFLGGVVAVLVTGMRHKVPTRWTMQLVGPALAASYAVGRVGCFLVGDDYGGPSTLPWAVKFPEGLPPSTVSSLQEFGVRVPAGLDPATVLAVHPTQIYETVIMLGSVCVSLVTAERADRDRCHLRALPDVRRRGALPGGDPARERRPVPGPVHDRAGHEHRRGSGWRSRVREAQAGRHGTTGGISRA